jgi:hypothetical protein
MVMAHVNSDQKTYFKRDTRHLKNDVASVVVVIVR